MRSLRVVIPGHFSHVHALRLRRRPAAFFRRIAQRRQRRRRLRKQRAAADAAGREFPRRQRPAGRKNQDQGYSNGAAITFVSPNLTDYTGDPCLPWLARRINGYLENLSPGRYEEQNMVLSINHSLYTPEDWTRSDLIVEDRPYAGLLYVGLGYNARDGHLLRHTQLQLGVVGPWAQGEQVQDALGDEKFAGWRHQLRNEPIVNLVHERMARWPRNGTENAYGWGWDAIGHWGAALGNRATHANAGMELRFGWKLPDDFGSTPLRPAGENTAPLELDRRLVGARVRDHRRALGAARHHPGRQQLPRQP